MFFGCNLSSQKEGSNQVRWLICEKDLLLSFSWKGHIGCPGQQWAPAVCGPMQAAEVLPSTPPGFQGTPPWKFTEICFQQRAAFPPVSTLTEHRAQRILTVETKMCIFVINSVAIVITCITFLCISLSWQFFIKYNVCLGEMLLLLYCRGTHLSPSELLFSLHAQKISPSMENSQTSVLCAG